MTSEYQSNNSWNAQTADAIIEDSDDVSTYAGTKFLLYLLYTMIFIIGISGNLLVCYVVVRNKCMHTVTNIFITNLALSDVLLCIFAVPFTPLYLLTFKDWVFGEWLCHFVPFAQGISVYISAITLMTIAIDRFFVIIHPFKPRMKLSICFIIIITIWAVAVFLTLPYGYFMSLRNENNGTRLICEELWPNESFRRTFTTATSSLQFAVPFVVILYCYIKVCGKLTQRTNTLPGAKSAKKEESDRKRTQRTNRMLITMVVIFGISWLPLNSHNLILDFYIPAYNWPFISMLFLVSHTIAMSSTCYNPFLYAWLNDNFRKEFREVLPCIRRSRMENNSLNRLSVLEKINNNNSGCTQESLISGSCRLANL